MRGFKRRLGNISNGAAPTPRLLGRSGQAVYGGARK